MKSVSRKKITRKKFIQSTALAMAGAGALGFPSVLRASKRPPNILLITADDLGWKELRCYGNKDIHTPNIDRLAKGGVKFTNAFVSAPSCSPSRSSIMTGQAPHSVGVHGLTHIHRQYQMSPKIPTLARILRDNGYRTAIQGKWHVAPFKPVGKYGYQRRFSFQRIEHSFNARHFIASNRNRPFFMELNFFQTHRLMKGKFYMSKKFPVDPERIKVPDYWQIPDWPEIREDVAKYYSQAAEMDSLIGEIMDKLEREKLVENTMIVFVSDNGAPYPGCKMTLYDRGIGTPFVIRWPEAISPDQSRDMLASTIDIMPTCLAAAGLKAPEVVQGTSLLGAANGKVDKVHDAVFAELTYHVYYAPMRAIRTREWKYIENLSSDPLGLDQTEFDWSVRVSKLEGQKCCIERPPEELYDLKADPNETKNLAAESSYGEIKEKLINNLHEWRKETNDPFPNV